MKMAQRKWRSIFEIKENGESIDAVCREEGAIARCKYNGISIAYRCSSGSGISNGNNGAS